MKIKIITDSTSDLTISYAQSRDICILPIGIEIDGVFYKEGVDITPSEFYDKLRRTKNLPHTSQINEYAFNEEFEKLKSQDYFICVLNISKDLSNTYSQSLMAAKNFPNENIYICDTKTTTVGLAMLVEYAVFLSEKKDITPQDFIFELEQFRDRIRVYGVISDLKYLKMGGRLSTGAAFVGSMLKINPLVVVDKKVKMISKHIGKKRAFAELAQILAKRNMNFPVYIGHTDCFEFMKNMLASQEDVILPDSRERYFDMGAAIGTHVGPGSVAVAFISDD